MYSFRKPRLLKHTPRMAEPEARTWQRRLGNLRQQCGCSAGALALGGFALAFPGFCCTAAHQQLASFS